MKFAANPSFPVGALIWSAVAASLLGAGLVLGNAHLGMVAAPAFALAIMLAIFRPAAVEGELTETGLRLRMPVSEVPYASIHALTLRGLPQDPDDPKLKAGPIVIVHRAGVLEIPNRLDLPIKDLYRGLLERIQGCGSREVAELLRDYQRAEETAFGADRVSTYCARARLGRRPSTRRAQAICLALVAAGIFWTVGAFVWFGGAGDDAMPWPPLGIFMAIVAGFGWLIALLSARHPDAALRRWREASLVVSPTGIALTQADMQGQMRWDELLDVTLRARQPFIAAGAGQHAPGGIQVTVAGAVIRIADIYDRPLPTILQTIRRYWKGPGQAPQPGRIVT